MLAETAFTVHAALFIPLHLNCAIRWNFYETDWIEPLALVFFFFYIYARKYCYHGQFMCKSGILNSALRIGLLLSIALNIKVKRAALGGLWGPLAPRAPVHTRERLWETCIILNQPKRFKLLHTPLWNLYEGPLMQFQKHVVNRRCSGGGVDIWMDGHREAYDSEGWLFEF